MKVILMPDAPYAITYTLHPYRLLAHHADQAILEISLTNTSNEELLTSLTITVPKALGLDRSAISHERELRLGTLAPREQRHATITIYATQRTPRGTYTLHINAASHYRNYGYILNEVRCSAELRVE